MLTQEQSNKHRPVAYYSRQTASVAYTYPSCRKAMATAAKIVEPQQI